MKRALAIGLAMGCSACSSSELAQPVEPACEPRMLGPDAAFAEVRDPASSDVALATAIAKRYIARHPPEEALWDWGEGVLMLGMVDLYRLTGDSELRDYYRAWIDHHRLPGYRHLIVSSDRCPPATVALALYQETCELGYREIVSDTLHFLYEEALRDDQGGINHLGTNDLFGISLWLDSLFMFGGVLSRWGEHAEDERALDEYHDQFVLFASQLQDPGGLMVHAHNWALNAQDPDVYWARGNAWVTAAGYEYLRVRPDAEVEAILQIQVDAVTAAQDPTEGLWWTVINRPGDTYTETSASALFAVGMARALRYGFADASVKPTIDAAMDGVRARIVDDGDGPRVTGISGPTGVGNFDDYAAIEVVDDLHYGVGAVILALVETSGL